MKTTVFLGLVFLIVLMFLYVSDTTAEYESYMQWGLPAGVTARLGKGGVREIAYSPDGTRLAVASTVGIWMYDAGSGEALALFTGHTRSVESVVFSADGRVLARI